MRLVVLAGKAPKLQEERELVTLHANRAKTSTTQACPLPPRSPMPYIVRQNLRSTFTVLTPLAWRHFYDTRYGGTIRYGGRHVLSRQAKRIVEKKRPVDLILAIASCMQYARTRSYKKKKTTTTFEQPNRPHGFVLRKCSGQLDHVLVRFERITTGGKSAPSATNHTARSKRSRCTHTYGDKKLHTRAPRHGSSPL